MPLPDYHDFFDRGERELVSLKPDIDPAEIRRAGSDTNIVVAASAAMAEQLAKAALDEFSGLFFETARREALDRLAWDRFRLTRYAAAASRGTLLFWRNDDTLGSTTIPRLTIATDDEGREFQTLESVVLPDKGPVSARGICRLTGALSNARVGTISAMLTKLSDPGIRVTNAGALLKFTRALAGDSGTIPSLTRCQDAYGNVWLTNESLVFSSSMTEAFVPALIASGHDLHAPAAAATITQILDSLFDTFTVDNPVASGGAFAGGDDDEQDGAFVERCQQFWAAARRGTLGAIETGCREVPGVRRVQVIEETTDGEAERVVRAIIADRNGIGSDALVAECEESLRGYRPGGTWVFVEGAEVELTNISVRLGFSPGVDTTLKAQEVENRIGAMLDGLPPSSGVSSGDNKGALWIPDLFKLLREIPDVYAFYNSVLAPTADVVPDRGVSLRLGTLTVTWV